MLGPLEELLHNENAVNMDFKEHVSLVHRNALRLLKLVNNLLGRTFFWGTFIFTIFFQKYQELKQEEFKLIMNLQIYKN